MKNTLNHNGYQARVDFDPEDCIFVGRIVGIDDNISFHGDSVDDLVAAFHEAVEDYIETCEEVGKTPEKSYSGNVFLRVRESTHARAAKAAELSGFSLNQFGEMALERLAETFLSQLCYGRDLDAPLREELEQEHHHHA